MRSPRAGDPSGGLPRYASMTRGSVRTFCGGPRRSSRRNRGRRIRSETSMTTFMSCSMRKTVMPWLRMSWMSCISSFFSCGLKPAAGSSSIRSFGWVASARRNLESPLEAVGQVYGRTGPGGAPIRRSATAPGALTTFRSSRRAYGVRSNESQTLACIRGCSPP